VNKVSVFVDITDLYYKLHRTFGSGKLDYVKYLDKVKEITGKEVATAVAYGCQDNNEAASFIGYLRSVGFKTKYKRPYILKVEERNIKRCNWVGSIAVDTIKDEASTIVICSSNPDIMPIIKSLIDDYQKEVIIIACNIPSNLKNILGNNAIEIEKELLENVSDTHKS